MTIFNYSLNVTDYSLKNALFWGNCAGHWKKALESRSLFHDKVIHLFIAGIQFLPLISQIASLFEAFIVTRFVSSVQMSLDHWVIENEDGGNYKDARKKIMEFVDNQRETRFQLSNLRLDSLPDIFHDPAFSVRLTELDLGLNNLQNLPPSFVSMTSLEKLNLIGNKIQNLPDLFGQMSSLTELNLTANQLTALPATFGQLRNLKVLNARFNKIKTLPANFCQLSRLETIHLGENPLSSLPDDIGQLRALNSAYFEASQFAALPRSIGELSSLAAELKISGNIALTEIPVEIFNLPRSCSISLSYRLPDEVKERVYGTTKAPGYQGPDILFVLD